MSFQVKCEICGTRVAADPQMVGHQMVCPECGQQFTVPMTSITAGLVEDDFWIQKSLGSGNVGEVFLAKRLAGNEKIILKALSPAVTVDPMATNAFLVQLQQAATAIDHPNFSNVIEVSEMAGHSVYVMPYVPGECLDRKVTSKKPMPERDALKLILKIARFMRIAWDQSRLVHGSIRPGNILIDNEGDPHILEAGNFKRLLAGNTLSLDHLNKAGSVADYMSPEQAQGVQQLDCRSDIYSLGATFFYMLTGARPYNGINTTEVLHNHLNAPVPDPQDYNKKISDEGADLIFDMMAKNPDERFQTWRELTDEVKGLLRAKGRGTETEIALKTQMHMRAVKHDSDPAKKEKNVMVLAVVGIVAFLLLGMILLGVLATVMSNKPGKTKPPKTPANTNTKPNRPKRKSVFDKKVEFVLSYYAKDKAKRGQYAIERLQMVEATAAKTDADRNVIKSKIAEIKAEMKTLGVKPEGTTTPAKPPANPPQKPTPANQGSAKVLENGFVDFEFLGPLPMASKDKAWDAIKSARANHLPDFSKAVQGVKWRRLYKASDRGMVDYSNKGTGNRGDICFFAAASIILDKAINARIHLSHDDGMIVWLNQKTVYQSNTLGFNKAVDISLNKGRNVIICRNNNDGGGFKFNLAITDRRNAPLPTKLVHP